MRTDRSDWLSAYSAWLSAILLILIFEVALIGSMFAYPSVGGLRAVWSVGPWYMWSALTAIALTYTVALIRGRGWFDRAALCFAAGLLVVFGVALSSFRMGPLHDRWYAAAIANERERFSYEAFALIEFESPNTGPCGGVSGRCVLLLLDDGRRMWMPLSASVDPHARIVVVERPTGELSGRSRLVVRDALSTEDWQLSWALHLRREARYMDESTPLEY